jgi:hypothetical protein
VLKTKELTSFAFGILAKMNLRVVFYYSKDTKYEAERANIPTTLIDPDNLVSLSV